MQVLIIARRDAPALSVLDTLPEDVELTIGRTVEEIGAAVEQAEVIVNGSHDAALLEAIWPRAGAVRWVHSLSAGVESIVFPALKSSHVPLTNARGVYRRSLAEFAVLGMLWFAKDARRLVRQQDAARWEQFDCNEIHRSTCGILGYGEIGREVAVRARAMGQRVIATRRRATLAGDDLVSEVFAPERSAELMAQSDYVVCCLPLTPATRHSIGKREFSAMKRTGVFINIGRGATTDENALIAALQEHRIGGAALDVFETEPLEADSPFWKLDNLLLSPHCTDHTATWQQESMQFFVDNFRRYTGGEPLQNIVDKDAGY